MRFALITLPENESCSYNSRTCSRHGVQ